MLNIVAHRKSNKNVVFPHESSADYPSLVFSASLSFAHGRLAGARSCRARSARRVRVSLPRALRSPHVRPTRTRRQGAPRTQSRRSDPHDPLGDRRAVRLVREPLRARPHVAGALVRDDERAARRQCGAPFEDLRPARGVAGGAFQLLLGERPERPPGADRQSRFEPPGATRRFLDPLRAAVRQRVRSQTGDTGHRMGRESGRAAAARRRLHHQHGKHPRRGDPPGVARRAYSGIVPARSTCVARSSSNTGRRCCRTSCPPRVEGPRPGGGKTMFGRPAPGSASRNSGNVSASGQSFLRTCVRRSSFNLRKRVRRRSYGRRPPFARLSTGFLEEFDS